MGLLRILLLPFSMLYALIILLRNFLYDSNLLKSTTFDIPVITVGNLSTGGTGKSPMIEYLLSLLISQFKTATLSRGYKRKTKGFKIVNEEHTAEEVGDEPLQFKMKYPIALIAVDENRRRGINNLISKQAEVILLDDAFQHRKVKGGLQILLTSYSSLYVNDFILPTGNLREPAIGADRAQIIVVTKCPLKLAEKEKRIIRKKLQLRNYQNLFFSYISYSSKIHNNEKIVLLTTLKDEKFTLVTGIANPKPLVSYLEKSDYDFEHLKFPDHHNFSAEEINHINTIGTVLTTEKDYMRLNSKTSNSKLYYLPIKMKFLNDPEQFDGLIESFVNKN